MLLAAYDAVESLASLSSRVESRFRSDKKRTLKSAPVELAGVYAAEGDFGSAVALGAAWHELPARKLLCDLLQLGWGVLLHRLGHEQFGREQRGHLLCEDV